jgi:hypothetical protein
MMQIIATDFKLLLILQLTARRGVPEKFIFDDELLFLGTLF